MKLSTIHKFVEAMAAQGITTVADFISAYPGMVIRERKL